MRVVEKNPEKLVLKVRVKGYEIVTAFTLGLICIAVGVIALLLGNWWLGLPCSILGPAILLQWLGNVVVADNFYIFNRTENMLYICPGAIAKSRLIKITRYLSHEALLRRYLPVPSVDSPLYSHPPECLAYPFSQVKKIGVEEDIYRDSYNQQSSVYELKLWINGECRNLHVLGKEKSEKYASLINSYLSNER